MTAPRPRKWKFHDKIHYSRAHINLLEKDVEKTYKKVAQKFVDRNANVVPLHWI